MMSTPGNVMSTPGKLSRLMVGLVWPLIWVGGLVTTYDAGMSVPDWPNTYGYNLFSYPLSTWLLGPFDLLIEHGHRLLGAAVGFVAIGLVAWTWATESRRWVLWLSLGLLLGVIGQGILGGIRVTASARTLAMIHGCTAPALFALTVVAACVTGRRWTREQVVDAAGPSPRPTPRLFWPLALMGLAYMQLLLGAQLRHASPTFSATGFGHIVTTHISLGVFLWLMTGLAWWRSRRCGDLTLSRPAGALVCFAGLQIALGVGTWLVNYGYPKMLATLPSAQGYLLQSKDMFDALIVTSHVAVGALILAVATLLLVRSARRRTVLSAAVL